MLWLSCLLMVSISSGQYSYSNPYYQRNLYGQNFGYSQFWPQFQYVVPYQQEIWQLVRNWQRQAYWQQQIFRYQPIQLQQQAILYQQRQNALALQQYNKYMEKFMKHIKELNSRNQPLRTSTSTTTPLPTTTEEDFGSGDRSKREDYLWDDEDFPMNNKEEDKSYIFI